jgi:hypothetical protein
MRRREGTYAAEEERWQRLDTSILKPYMIPVRHLAQINIRWEQFLLNYIDDLSLQIAEFIRQFRFSRLFLSEQSLLHGFHSQLG